VAWLCCKTRACCNKVKAAFQALLRILGLLSCPLHVDVSHAADWMQTGYFKYITTLVQDATNSATYAVDVLHTLQVVQRCSRSRQQRTICWCLRCHSSSAAVAHDPRALPPGNPYRVYKTTGFVTAWFVALRPPGGSCTACCATQTPAWTLTLARRHIPGLSIGPWVPGCGSTA
jgi:hypothetical protein